MIDQGASALLRRLLAPLKAERIQLGEEELLEGELQLPDWSSLAGEYVLPTPAVAWAFASFLRELAASAGVELAMTVEGSRVLARPVDSAPEAGAG